MQQVTGSIAVYILVFLVSVIPQRQDQYVGKQLHVLLWRYLRGKILGAGPGLFLGLVAGKVGGRGQLRGRHPNYKATVAMPPNR